MYGWLPEVISIRTAFIDAIRDMHDSEANFTDQFIRVYYRRNDANRPKIGDGSYLDQLYLCHTQKDSTPCLAR